MNWELTISLHWPHDRFALGYQYIGDTEEEKLRTYVLFLLIVTLELHIPTEK
tara:strand:- start:697 stop:852 length:156 start_codon:yes stop_codon:yes gene_type:complete